MLKILLVIIYIAFISLGLPDAIMGSAWPMIHTDLNVPISYAGVATMVVAGGTIVSSFFSEKLIRKFGTGKVTAVSVLLTATGLLGIYFSPSFVWICILGIPLGLGAGAVDSALNNFVALHYEAKHMNWLHCFWGIGATAGPFIMSMYLLKDNGWRNGYASIGIFQVILVVCLFISLPLWNKFEVKNNKENKNKSSEVKISTLIKLPGAKPALVAFFCYCAAELTAGLWASSFLVVNKGLSAELAAKWVSLYYLGITIGRFLAGFIAMKLNNNQMIRMGQIIAIVGTIFLFLPNSIFSLVGLILIGLGCAPIYPAMLHETPNRFSEELSQGIMGIQMATAYVGSTFVPPLFGVISKYSGFTILPLFLLVLVLIMLLASERVKKICESGSSKEHSA